MSVFPFIRKLVWKPSLVHLSPFPAESIVTKAFGKGVVVNLQLGDLVVKRQICHDLCANEHMLIHLNVQTG